MFVRSYLRASTDEQDASRAAQQLVEFADGYGQRVAATYTENASGTRTDRPELIRLLNDAQKGDILLVEGVDRLSRMDAEGWSQLRNVISEKGMRVVALDLPTSHTAMGARSDDEFTQRMLDAINGMMLDMLAAIARKDYDDRRRRQAQGIAQAKERGVYRGRPIDQELRTKVDELRAKGFSVRRTAELAGCSPSTVQRIQKERTADVSVARR